MEKQILDACCGAKMFWFDKQYPHALFCDIRDEVHTLCDGRVFKVKPDALVDFRNMPHPDEHFNLVVYDPPHLEIAGERSWQGKKYGKTNRDGLCKNQPESAHDKLSFPRNQDETRRTGTLSQCIA